MEHRFELVEGRTVLHQIAEGEYRPATVVKVWNPKCCNLVVFLDGTNDDRYSLVLAGVIRDAILPAGLTGAQLSVPRATCIGWATSRVRGTDVGQWITPQELVSLRAGA